MGCIALCFDIQYFPNKRKAPVDCSRREADLEIVSVGLEVQILNWCSRVECVQTSWTCSALKTDPRLLPHLGLLSPSGSLLGS